MSIEAMKQWLVALESAQDNLRPHEDNCFLHDEGEYNRCFCGKDSLSDFLQEQVESLSQAIEQAEKQDVEQSSTESKETFDQPVAWVCEGSSSDEKHSIDYWQDEIDAVPVGTMLYTTPQPQREWVGLTEEQIMHVLGGNGPDLVAYARAIEAKLREKNGDKA